MWTRQPEVNVTGAACTGQGCELGSLQWARLCVGQPEVGMAGTACCGRGSLHWVELRAGQPAVGGTA